MCCCRGNPISEIAWRLGICKRKLLQFLVLQSLRWQLGWKRNAQLHKHVCMHISSPTHVSYNRPGVACSCSRRCEGWKFSRQNKFSQTSLPHIPLVQMSSLTPCCELAVAPVRCSVVTGCRSGSMQTSMHTSASRLAVRSQISLCLIGGKPPLVQESACSRVNPLWQKHLDSNLEGVHPYLRAIAS